MGEMIASTLLQGAADLITTLGADPLHIAGRANIPAPALFDPTITVLSYDMTDFFELAAQDCRCRNFGLMMAERSSLAVVGPLWTLMNTAGTIREMVDDLVSNFVVYSEAAIISLTHTDDGALMSFEGRAGHSHSEIQMMEFALAITCAEMRRHFAPDWNPTMVQFRHAAPIALGVHQRYFGPELMFEQDRNAIYMDAATLRQARLPNQGEPRAAAKLIVRELSGRQAPDLAVQVEGAIRSANFTDCSVKNIAEAIGISQRTLQRRLAAQATSITIIKDTVRADLALKYVRQSTLQLGQISEILGYSELSAFTRAFKHWHGRSASALRRPRDH